VTAQSIKTPFSGTAAARTPTAETGQALDQVE